MLDVRLRNKVRNEEIRKRTRVENVIELNGDQELIKEAERDIPQDGPMT